MSLAMLDDIVAFDHDRASLDAIAQPDAALAILWRSLRDTLRAALASLDLGTVDDVSVCLATDEAIGGVLTNAGYADPVATLLADDIGLLVRRHAALIGEDRLRLRLEVVETDACRRFHDDFVTLRLLCSYVGPGTQW